ncbi:MAG TPA: VWA domain-containing protein [Vicinamibacteria bacterium]|nr:VWA domain-containing protein [Vicinamibacteria bacterium]
MATAGSMRRSGTLVALLASAAMAGSQEPPPPVFPAGVEQVTVDVVVVDREGAPVRGLARADFTLLEDGVRQEIATFEAIDVGAPTSSAPETQPEVAPAPPEPTGAPKGPAVRVFVVVFDDLHIDAADAPRARAAIGGFLDDGVAPGDRLMLVVPGRGTVWHARVPDGVDGLRKLLPQLAGRARTAENAREWMTDEEAIRIRDGDPLVFRHVVRRWGALATDVVSLRDKEPVEERVASRARYVAFDVERRTRQTLEVLSRAMEAVAGVRGRKSVILVSAGIVRDTFLPGFRAVVAAAASANAAVHFVDARGLVAVGPDQTEAAAPTDLQDYGLVLGALDAATEGAEGLAADTGGLSIRKRNDLAAGLNEIARESSSYYLVGYPAPAGGRPDRFRRIEVRVEREDVRVRARRGYYPTPAADRSPSRQRERELEHAVDSPLDAVGIPVRAAAFVLGDKPEGKVRVLLTTEVDVRALELKQEGAASAGKLDLVVAIQGEGGTLQRSAEPVPLRLRPDEKERLARTWLALTREAALPPGRYQARVVVRDAGSGRIGSLLQDFEVPATGRLRLSTPLLGDRLRAAGNPEPIARRVFSPSGTLHARFEVCGAAKGKDGAFPVKAGFAVLREDGRMLAASPATAVVAGPDGTLSRSFGIPLEGAAAGRYVLVVVAEDGASGERAETREAFVVEGAASR